ncbi:MAG TPA: group II intron maturase-specific domain-containing protein [Anaerovoracaceae bacterium]|nr:group II intron maturase-specific domain-containing protein [Anaerovoracaceae bacterium]
MNRQKAKIKKLTSRKWSVSMSYRMTKLNQVIRGWVNYYRISQMKMVCKEIDAHRRFTLRMCIWKQWKKLGKRYRSLIQLGINKSKATQE